MAFRNLKLPWNEIDPRLGIENDSSLGEEYGCNAITIYRRRLKLGISACKTQSNYFDWAPHAHLLGTMFDYDLSQLLGIHETTVSNERWARGIPAFVDPRHGHHIDWDSVDLGLRADEKIAKEYNVGTHAVIREREKRGIPCFGVNGRRLDWEKYGHLFGCTPEREIAQITGFELSTIYRIMERQGIPAYKFTYVTEENERVDSYPEAVIDIYFHQKSIPHKFHVKMGNTRYHCDWIINGDTAVEFAGYADHPKRGKAYKEKLAKKLSLYDTLGYKTLVIYYKDLKNYDLGIPPKYTGHLILEGVDFNEVADLGAIPDTHIAKRLNVSPKTVGEARFRLGIPPFKPYQPTEEQWASVIWTDTNEEIGAQLGISDFRVYVYREAHGIPSNPSGHSRNRDWSKVVLGSDTDDNLGLVMGISGAAIRKRRVKLGIPAFNQDMSARSKGAKWQKL